MAILQTRATVEQTVPGMFFSQAARQGNRTALRYKRYGIWHRITWEEYARRVRFVANGLLSLGLERGERVGLIGENRPEWVICDLGIQAAGGITTAIYTTSSPEQVAYILGHSEARLFIVENEEQLDKALVVRGHLPRLERIIVMDREGLRGFIDPQVMFLDELMELGEQFQTAHPHLLEERLREIDPEDVAVLIYTSGTTGPPKGVMLTHHNILWTTEALAKANPVYPTDEVLSFLPLSHIAERQLSVFLPVRWGYTVNFCENLDTVLQNLREVSPTVIFAVPRIWEKIYSGVELHMQEADFAKRMAYRWAVRIGRRYAEAKLSQSPPDAKHVGRWKVPWWLRALYFLAHTFVLLPLKRKLGLDRARLVLSGAAPIAPDILWYFWSIGVPIREVYGQTEGSGPTTIHQGEDIKLGTVGKPLPGVEVRIAEDGEILVRGPNVFKGYFKDPDATASTLRDGWLHSGDVGVLDEEGYLRITDRKKDLFITSGGKNIAPQYIENKLKFSPYIHDAVVVGDGRRYLVALIVIDEENVTKWAQDRRIPFTTYSDLAGNPEVYKLISAEVEAVNRTLSSPEQVKKFAILPRRLYEEEGEITPTLKVKRKAIMEKYRDLIESLYR
ncbi:MAG: AMP-binding protein [Armatimonadota bacterium]|nr:AMP-binding protein [Armatimonadota bacterium]MDR5702901.1 AMP-binding protein [Armatimonadota bacterium]MDR7434782.1 AMP-binding protein [Armatimonadota bacterium]